jgi:hypothetical protein
MGFVDDKIAAVAAQVTLESERTRTELADQFSQTVRGLRIDGALPRPFRTNAENYTAAGRLVGWSLRASGADATITFRDGHNTDADPIATVVIPAGKSDTTSAPGSGVSFVDALYAEVAPGSGTIVGAVWIGAVD